MQQTWERQQPSSYVASTMQPASHAWDVWQSDSGQGMNGQEISSYSNMIYPPGTYTAGNQNQGAGGSYYNTVPQETWHTDPAAAYNPDSQAPPPPPAAVVSSEGCTQTAPYGSCFGSHPPANYQQNSPWSYPSADSGTPEPNVYYAGAAPYPNGDHPLYLDHAAEQQRQIEHAQYLISRWGASDDSTPAPDSASPVMNSSGAASTAIFPAPYNHVQDQHWTPEGATPSSSSSWGTFGTRPQCTSWPYNASQARAAIREHGSQTQALPPPPPLPPASAPAAGAMSSERRQQSWAPREFQPDDQDGQRSMELSPSTAAAAK